VVDHPEPTVLLNAALEHLNNHGSSARFPFPAARSMRLDASPLEAALREAHEEVGLTRDFIEPIGYLEPLRHRVRLRILPTVARVKPGFQTENQRGRSRRRLEVPLAFLMIRRTTRSTTRNSAAWSVPITRCRLPSVTSGARPRGSCGCCTSDLSRMIRPVLTEVGIFLIPFASMPCS